MTAVESATAARGATTEPAVVSFDHVTHWYGNVVAVNDITLELGPGVTGLLGPNGAGKSTILHLLSGFLSPSRGAVTIGGAGPWRNPAIFDTVGLVPERDSVYAFLTAREFVTASARLHRMPDLDLRGQRDYGPKSFQISCGHKGQRQELPQGKPPFD